jgi:phage terminase large subunit-like protein
MRDYAAIAAEYVRDVLDGTIPANKLTRLACQRQLDNLAQGASFPWMYDTLKGIRVCAFVERCPHVKGRKFAGKPLVLSPFQVFLLMTAFSWLGRTNGLRRFRRVYTEIAKGNGKSPLIAALCLYMAFVDGEPGAEVYTAAWGIKQARVVFDTAQQMLRKMPNFCREFGIEVGQHSLYQQSTGSFIRPLSREANLAEGSLPYFTSVDELHVHPKRDLHDNLVTSNGKRDGSMLWAITTSGTDRASVCYEQHEYLQRVLEGVLKDETYFGCIWSADPDDDPWLEATWRKANPNWGISVNPESIRNEAERAKQIASAQPAFFTKHLDIWCQSDRAWMDMHRFMKCADRNLSESAFAGQPCVLGLDIARKLDLLASVKLFWKQLDGKRHYYAFGKYWTPQASVEKSDNASYKGWVINGHLQTCEGETNDLMLVEDEIRAACKQFAVVEVAHDPYGALELVNNLMKERIPMFQVDQNVKNLSEPMKELEAAVYDGRFHYNGDPILTWAMSNVVCHLDKNDNLFPNKEGGPNSPKKIDPVSALLNGLNRCIALHATGALKPRRTELLVF